MTVFAAAVNRLFADRNLAVAATYFVHGNSVGREVRVILSAPDDVLDFASSRIAVETVVVQIRVSDVARPAKGDELLIGTDKYVIQEGARRDAERLTWTVGARPKAP